MKIGSFVFATDQGLGILAKSFYDHGVVTDVLVIHHRSRPVHMEWYLDTEYIQATNLESMKKFVDRMDCMLFFETPFNWNIVDYCRKVGCRSVIMPMYECMPAVIPHEPDLWICPSLLDYSYFPKERNLTSYSIFIPVPVESAIDTTTEVNKEFRTKKPLWRQRTKAEVFIHNAGHGGLRGRNGTRELVEALKYVQSEPTICFRVQDQAMYNEIVTEVTKASSRVEVTLFYGTVSRNELWNNGDVFIFPEKFNGLSLPLQEARAAGMLVIATDRFPMNTWLPTEPLIRPVGYSRARVAGHFVEFDEAIINPRNIAEKIDEWYGKDITQYSLDGEAWARSMSWEVLKPRYMEVLQSCVSST